MQMDVNAILGDALSALTNELGIDMTKELENDPQASSKMKAIVASSMQELAKNMEDLDKQSVELYEKLGNLQEELVNETTQFEEAKQMELGELLQMQNKFKTDFEKSSDMVQNRSNSILPLSSLSPSLYFYLFSLILLLILFFFLALWI